jgi:hypothetical protein
LTRPGLYFERQKIGAKRWVNKVQSGIAERTDRKRIFEKDQQLITEGGPFEQQLKQTGRGQ